MAANYEWKLAARDRLRLLELFEPTWPDIIADHVTHGLSDERAALLCTAGEVVGSVDDGEGLQTLIVAIGGSTTRPDGKTYHITWSIDRARGRRPVESNEVIARLGWVACAKKIAVSLFPS